MKRMFTLISAILVCVLCIILSVLDVFYSNDENIYILCDYNNNYKVVTIDENMNNNDEFLDVNVYNRTYAYADNAFYFFSKNAEIDENSESALPYTLIESYDCKTGIQRKRLINYAEPEISGTYAVDSEKNYYIIGYNSVEIYNSNYKYLKTISMESNPINLTNSSDGRIVYIITENGITIISNNTEYSYNINCSKIFSLNNNYFATDTGILYCFDNGNVSEIYNGFECSHGLAIIDDRIFGIKGGELAAVDNEKEILLGEIESDAYICSVGEKCLCITQNGDSVNVEHHSLLPQ